MPLIDLRLMKVVSCWPTSTRKPTCITNLHTKTVSFITLKAGYRKSLIETFYSCILLPNVTICVQVGKDIAFHGSVFKGARISGRTKYELH